MATDAGSSWGRGHAGVASEPRSLAVVTGAFGAMLLCSNLAAPLYAGYSDQFGFSTAVLGLIFAVYALALMPPLVLFGQVSDRLGRRGVIASGLAVQVGALGVFAATRGVVWLFVARALQGLVQGMMSGAATAALAELVSGKDTRRPALLATLAQSGGSATGGERCLLRVHLPRRRRAGDRHRRARGRLLAVHRHRRVRRRDRQRGAGHRRLASTHPV